MVHAERFLAVMNRVVYCLLFSGILRNVSGNNNPEVTVWAAPPLSPASVTSAVPVVAPPVKPPLPVPPPLLSPPVSSTPLPATPTLPTPSALSVTSSLPSSDAFPTSLPLPAPPRLPTPPALPIPPSLPSSPAPPPLLTPPAPPVPSALPANLTLIPPLDPSYNQLEEFRMQHPRPIGVLTTSAGKPVEVRESVALNTDVFNNAYFYDLQTSVDHERIPERVVHAKGNGAFGYFEVTNDVSKYTKAEVFNGIGKKTPLAARFSIVVQNLGGNDLTRETRSFSIKLYTNEGNLDFLNLHIPVYFYRYPNLFTSVSHAFHRNPKTNLYDSNMRVELLTLTPETIHTLLWLLSDYGQTNGYRKFDSSPVHAYEVNNKHGESFFVRFNFRTEQGAEYITEASARILGALDADYSGRDLYNAIASGNYPSWRLEMDILTKENITKLNYNPFDVTRLWEEGTYQTVTIGRVVLNRNVDNFFSDVEQAAYNPGNLVPGIPGPHDDMYKARRLAYRDIQNYRLGVNHNNIEVNSPKYKKVYNRDGDPPVGENMGDAPNYYQNSFNGPVPYVDAAKPKERLIIYDRNAVDLQPSADFYNKYVTTEGGRNRMAANIAGLFVNAAPFVAERGIKILTLIDQDLGRRAGLALTAARVAKAVPTVFVPIEENPRVVEVVPNPVPR